MQISLSNDTHLTRQYSFPRKHKLNHARVQSLCKELTPLSMEYRDPWGYFIQLWKTAQYGLIGSVYNLTGQLKIIPSHKIRNPLNAQQSSSSLLHTLENAPNSRWDLAYDISQLTLTIWPHLEAAGKTGDIADKLKQLSKAQRIAARTVNLPDGRIRYYDETTPAGNTDPSNRTAGGRSYVTEWNPKTLTTRSWMECYDHKGNVSQVHPKQVNGVDVHREHYPPTAKDLAARRLPANQNSKELTQQPLSPSSKHFSQTLQQTRLTSSYNSANPHNPIPAKGGAAGEIGGVACSVDYLHGLFNGIELTNNQQHFFYLPTDDHAFPFSHQEMRQIIREVANGVFFHSTAPFFSLHFNQDGEMFPVIHPAYENTLVGRVIGLLDYTMKGYLNGGIFQDNFVDAWANNPDWKSKEASALQQLIDFSDYCEQLMPGKDRVYLSTEELGILQSSIEALPVNEPAIFSDYTQFSNSFRIISKQEDWERHDNILVINSDFDVLYTIKPNAIYKKALDVYFREHGHYPQGYLKLKEIFDVMKERIHDHLVKFPLRKAYFSMLGVIGYFASYFSTLKKHRKVPVLPPMERASYECPPLFPHLPKKVKERIEITVNFHHLVQSLSPPEIHAIKRFRDEYDFPESDVNAKQHLKELLKVKLIAEIEHNLNGSKRAAFRKAQKQPNLDQHIDHLVNELLKVIKNCCEYLKTILEEKLQRKQQLLNRTYALTNEEQEEIQKVQQLKINLRAAKNRYQETLNSYPKFEFGKEIDLTFESRRAINDKIVKINEANLPEDPQEEWFNLKLKNIEEIIQKIEGKRDRIHETVAETLADQNSTSREFDAFFLSLKEDMSSENLLKGQRLLGGCGFHLTEGPVMPSALGKKVQHLLGSQLTELPNESWKFISDETEKGVLFSLQYESIPAWINDDFAWMENFFYAKSDSFWSHWQRAEFCLAKESPEDLFQLFEEVPALKNSTDHEGRTLLHLAAQGSHPAIVDALIQQGFSLLAVDRQGNLPIHYAVAHDKNSLPILLQTEETIHAANKNKETPLIIAIQFGQLKNVQKLVEAGAKNVYSHAGYNALHTALHHGYKDIALFLLDQRVVGHLDINSLAEEGGTPLMMACELRSLELVQKLTALNARIDQEKKDGVTAIEIAIQMDEIPILNHLLSLGNPSAQALETAAKEGSYHACQSLSNNEIFFQYRNFWGDSLFHIALRSGNINAFAPHIKALPPAVFEEENKKEETVRQLAIQGGYWELLLDLTNHQPLCFEEINALLIHPYHPIFNELIPPLSPDKCEQLMTQAAVVGNVEAISLFIEKGGVLKEEHIKWLVKWDAIYLLRRYFGSKLDISKDGDGLIEIAAASGSIKVLSYLIKKAKQALLPFNPIWIRKAVESYEVEALKLVLSLAQDQKAAVIDPQFAPLHFAAGRGCKKMVQYLLSIGVDVNAPNVKGRSALFYAIKARDFKTVKFLIKNCSAKIGAHEIYKAAAVSPQLFTLVLQAIPSVDAVRTAVGNTPLMLAVIANSSKGVKRLLKAGAEPRLSVQNGWTPTCYAASKGYFAVVQTLLQLTVDKESHIHFGKNALHWASEMGHPHVVKLLLANGFEADVKVADLAQSHASVLYELGKASQHDKAAYNAFIMELELISSVSQPDLDQILLKLHHLSLNTPIANGERGATPLQCVLIKLKDMKQQPLCLNWLNSFIHTLAAKIPELVAAGLDPNIRDSEGNTLAHLLLQLNVDPSSIPGINLTLPNAVGATPLHIAAQYADSQVLEALLPHVQQSINTEDKEGATPLFYALNGKDPLHINKLASCKADLNHVNAANVTPLFTALGLESLQMIKLLVESGASVNLPATGEERTALALAVEIQNEEIVRFLLNCGADPKKGDRLGIQPLHLASQMGNPTLFRLLTERGAPLEMPTKKGMLPVHYAAIGGHVGILKQLHEKRASLNTPTKNVLKKSKTPERIALHFAIARGQLEAMQFLLDIAGMVKEDFSTESVSVLDAGATSPAALQSLRTYYLSENPALLKKAAICALIHDNPEALKIIMKWGITSESDLGGGRFLLHYASQFGALQSTALLIEEGGNPLLMDRGGNTPLELAAKNDSFEQFESLFEYCLYLPEFDIESKNARGETLVHLASQAGNLSHLSVLAWAGASLSSVNMQDTTPLDELLHILSHTEEGEMKQRLIQAAKFLFICGAEIAEENKDNPFIITFKEHVKNGDTPLHIAVLLHEHVALDLFAKSIDVNGENNQRMTPLHYAADKGDETAVMTLLKAGAKKEIRDAQGRIPADLSANESIKRLLRK